MEIIRQVYQSLDSIKRISPRGVEHWMARDLQKPLGYLTWENFEKVIEKARMACESTNTDPNNHILAITNMVSIGSGAERKRRDFLVSRYGAYLIAMNGDPRLPQIATAQTYFAIQTRKQEIEDHRKDMSKRLELRERVKNANKHLGDAAKDSGVQNYALFHAAGYRGLYGLKLNQIKERKGIKPKEELLDRAGRAELAANEFRITQTEEALKQNEIKGDTSARKTHERVGKEVRNTIKKIGGTMPEDLPAEPSIKKLIGDKRKKKKRIDDNNKA